MAASSGFLNISKKAWLHDNLKKIYPGLKLILPNIFLPDETPFLGSIKVKNNNVKVFGGFGDLQTALYGSNVDEDEICLNLGTGSQVLLISNSMPDYSSSYDVKPYFGRYLKAITHIPAGRSLNFVKNEICKNDDFWKILNRTVKSQDNQNSPRFNLNLFESNWRYNKSNKNLIIESYKSDKNFYEDILHAFCNEYLIALNKINPDHSFFKLLLAGGKLKDINYVRQFFKSLDGYTLTRNKKSILDETLIGLNKLSKVYN
jgi:sugar (pentulose or hexulose) kinase